MTKPLTADPRLGQQANKYHKEVFQKWGNICYLCPIRGLPPTDAAHVIPRSKLGPLRYASVHFARPAHRACHERQERGILEWTLAIRQDAAREYNKISKIGMHVPEE